MKKDAGTPVCHSWCSVKYCTNFEVLVFDLSISILCYFIFFNPLDVFDELNNDVF